MERFGRGRAARIERLDEDIPRARRAHGDPAGGGLLERWTILHGPECRRVHTTADVVREPDRVLVGASRVRDRLRCADRMTTAGVHCGAVCGPRGAGSTGGAFL